MTSIPSYFVVMMDYVKLGREAIVDPEITRSGIIDRIVSGEYKRDHISFIHHVNGTSVEDVTDEIYDLVEQAHDRMEAEWRDQVQDAVTEQICEDRVCAADDLAIIRQCIQRTT